MSAAGQRGEVATAVPRRVRVIDVITHRRPEETSTALTALVELARAQGVRLRLDGDELAKHGGLARDPAIAHAHHGTDGDVDLCVALGGDGTILAALRRHTATGVPVFGVNFGEMGFLATVDREDAREGFGRALAGDFEVLSLPGVEISSARGRWLAFNDVSMHRQPGMRVADLAYLLGGDEVGRVRCDGLVVATPAGSTGYNLANGGPVMAWGVHGYVVSFIAPHSIAARALVVAPGDELAVDNRSREEPVDVTVDGRPTCTLDAAQRLTMRFATDRGALAQIPGSTFYQRLREKFGRLATMI